jgi:hypothetical protein
MNRKKIILWSFFNALGTLAYITLVALILQNGEKIFGKMQDISGPIAFLLLFILSAAITGALVLGRPIFLYLDNDKRNALILFFYTLAWLFLFLILSFVLMYLR